MAVYDEVCGMTIESESAAAIAGFQGRTYYFCSVRCRTKFEQHPGCYVLVEEDAEDWSEPSDPPAY